MTAAEQAFGGTPVRPFLSQDRVRWADVDLVGIMRFSAFPRLVENSEQDLSREAGIGYKDTTENPALWLPRRKLTIEYLAPARIDELLQLVTCVSRIGESSLVFNVDVMTADFRQLYATAEMVTVCVNAQTFAKVPLPDETRLAVSHYAMSVDAARAWVRDNRVGMEQNAS